MDDQPNITVGLCEDYAVIEGRFEGPFRGTAGKNLTGPFRAFAEGAAVVLTDAGGTEILRNPLIRCNPGEGATFSLAAVTIGRGFHWERRQSQLFDGALTLVAGMRGGVTAINTVPLELYLASVISSEMNSAAPPEFLKAQAITSRSWLVAMLEKKERTARTPLPSVPIRLGENEMIRWYDRQDHQRFDVCADDHCQRYQGIMARGRAAEAVTATRGLFLTWRGEVCDARYHKACGGLTERFATAWEDAEVPYLTPVSDGPEQFAAVETEGAAGRWFSTRPDAYCRTDDRDFLARILPVYDRETADFFRWQLIYERGELEAIIKDRSGMDFGTLLEIIPVGRGPSGRLHRLKIIGSKRTFDVGKELEIRRWLSPSHLYSSAFVVHGEGASGGAPARFVLHGGGWGHGVGLCQIGAAVMAERGFPAEAILAHYFPAASLERRYR